MDTLCDFPYHFLLERFGGDKKKKDELSDVKGKAFESYLSLVANRATGENTWEPLLYTKPKDLKGSEYCDLFHKINKKSVVFVEIKSQSESDGHKKGEKDSLISFVDGSRPGKPKKKDWGMLQVIKHIGNYRRYYDYQDDLYGVVITYGRFPETPSFNELVKEEIINTPKYKAHMEHPRNHHTIMLNCINAELFFSAIKQGAPIEKLLKRLASVSVIEISSELKKFIMDHGLKYGVGPLFERDIIEVGKDVESLIKEMT